jgi:hypothetical protein
MTRQAARFTGVADYHDPKGRFHFRYPTDWDRYTLDEEREGVLFAPDPADLDTHLSAWVSELPERIVAQDLDDLRAGVEEGLAGLPGLQVEASSDECLDNLVKFERVVRFRLGDHEAKRRTWILYVDRFQIVLTWQGSTVDDYSHWLPMANYAFAMFNIHEELWFATDRTLGFPT